MEFPVRGTWKRLRTNAGERKACVGHGSGANLVERCTSQVGERLHDMGDVRRAIGFAAVRNRCKVRTVGLGQHPIDRAQARRIVQIRSSFERDDAAERKVRAALQALPSLVGPTREAVEHRALGRSFCIEYVERLLPRFARVDDEWQ